MLCLFCIAFFEGGGDNISKNRILKMTVYKGFFVTLHSNKG